MFQWRVNGQTLTRRMWYRVGYSLWKRTHRAITICHQGRWSCSQAMDSSANIMRYVFLVINLMYFIVLKCLWKFTKKPIISTNGSILGVDLECTSVDTTREYCFASYGPLNRYVKLRFTHAPGMPGTFFPHRLQRKPLVSDPGMHHDTCVAYVPWCMTGSLIRGGGENVPGACATRKFTYLVRDPFGTIIIGPWNKFVYI